jgi:hypothetical protein
MIILQQIYNMFHVKQVCPTPAGHHALRMIKRYYALRIMRDKMRIGGKKMLPGG